MTLCAASHRLSSGAPAPGLFSSCLPAPQAGTAACALAAPPRDEQTRPGRRDRRRSVTSPAAAGQLASTPAHPGLQAPRTRDGAGGDHHTMQFPPILPHAPGGAPGSAARPVKDESPPAVAGEEVRHGGAESPSDPGVGALQNIAPAATGADRKETS